MMQYKGYIGHFFFDDKSQLFQGNIASSNDVITFQGKSVTTLQQAFRAAVDDYIEWCKKYGKVPHKQFL